MIFKYGFSDNYLCGGYAKYDEHIMNVIKECISHEGMILDPTYSGKSFYGMVDTIKDNISEYAGKQYYSGIQVE